MISLAPVGQFWKAKVPHRISRWAKVQHLWGNFRKPKCPTGYSFGKSGTCGAISEGQRVSQDLVLGQSPAPVGQFRNPGGGLAPRRPCARSTRTTPIAAAHIHSAIRKAHPTQHLMFFPTFVLNHPPAPITKPIHIKP